MSKFNSSLYFRDIHEKDFFLIQVINFGQTTDELKFVFLHSDAHTGVVYTESPNLAGESLVIRFQAEITYHSDGSILQKMLGYDENHSTVYKNPFGEGMRRTPLTQITDWTPLIRYRIVSYEQCRKLKSSNPVFLPSSPAIFSGGPFDCILLLGASTNPTPTPGHSAEIIYRLTNVADGVDVLLHVARSTYQGQSIHIPNTDTRFWSKLNTLEIVQWRGGLRHG